MASDLLPEVKAKTPEAETFRKRSMIFGVVLFILLVSGIIACVVTARYLLIAAVIGAVVLSELVWLIIMKNTMNKIRSLELKKNHIAVQYVIGRTENIKKAEITSVSRKGRAYSLFLKDGRRLITTSGAKLTPEGEDAFFTKKNLPQTELNF